MIIAADKIEKPKPVKKVAAKKAPVGKAKKLSAIDSVLNVVKRSKKQIHIDALKDKTGFKGQKLHNIVYILKKQGKIKSIGKGLYAKT